MTYLTYLNLKANPQTVAMVKPEVVKKAKFTTALLQQDWVAKILYQLGRNC